MEYWHNLLTEKSWDLLKRLKRKFNFILIGGWATYLYARAMKSRDIDMIVDFKTLAKIKKEFDLRKNDNLKKYEIKIEEVDIDIYIPYYSKLVIPLEKIRNEKIGGFTLPKIEELLILKQDAEKDRGPSEKGEKDRIDILSLLFNCNINFNDYYNLLKKYKKQDFAKRLISLVKNFKEYNYLGLTPRQLKLKKKKVLKKLI